jgi:hypothetical protein
MVNGNGKVMQQLFVPALLRIGDQHCLDAGKRTPAAREYQAVDWIYGRSIK